MKHLTPNPSTEKNPKRVKPSGWRWMALAIACVLGLGAAGTWFYPPAGADNVSKQEIQQRQLAFTQAKPLQLPQVAAQDIEKSLDEMRLQPADRAQLTSLVDGQQAGRASPSPNLQIDAPARLVSVTLWDTHSQDGDVVALSSAGYRREIVLTKAPQTVVVPLDGGGSILIAGIHDGGGGITLGLRGTQNELLMPIMSEGQTLILPIAR